MKNFIASLLFYVALFHHSLIDAAAPAFHVYLAEKWMEKFEDYSEEEKKVFVLGTLFPDIRYLGVIRREETHEMGLTIDDLLKTDDPFLKGKRLHAFVDETRHELFKRSNILSLLKDVPEENQVTFLKFLEDAVLYPKHDWTPVCRYLDSFVPSADIDYRVPYQSLNQWYIILKDYFHADPCDLFADLSAKDQGYSGASPLLIKKWAVLIPEYSQREDVQKYVSDLLEGFRAIFESGSFSDCL